MHYRNAHRDMRSDQADGMRKRDVKPNVITYNIIICLYTDLYADTRAVIEFCRSLVKIRTYIWFDIFCLYADSMVRVANNCLGSMTVPLKGARSVPFTNILSFFF